MALSILSLAGKGDGDGVLSATMRHVAAGGSSQAPRQCRDGCRWVGGSTCKTDDVIKQCVEGSEAGKVTDLNFHFKFLQEISGLEQYAANLRTLDLSSNNISDIAGLDGMAKLRELKLYGCQISRLQNLEPCRHLSALHLEDNRITAIEGLGSLAALEYLNLDNNRIQRIGKGLARLGKLKELHLCSNRLASLEGLAGLSLLEVFRVSQNQICDVTADQLKPLTKLDKLHLAGNQLTSLAFLGTPPKQSTALAVPGAAPRPAQTSARPAPTSAVPDSARTVQCLPNLALLDVSGNQLTTEALRNLPVLMQLTEVNLAENQILDIPAGLSTSWPSIEMLDLTDNQLHRPEGVRQLVPMVSLRELVLQGNPLADDKDALKRLLVELPSLEYLDDRPFTPPPEQDLVEEEVDGETFALTETEKSIEGQKPSSPSGSRPGTAARPTTGGSRPSTASSRPGTGATGSGGNPLMLNRLKLSERRFVGEEQVLAWEKQTKNGLAAIEKQLKKTEQQVDRDMADMNRYLHKAERVLARERELQERRERSEQVPEELEVMEPPPRPRAPMLESPPPSRTGRRLREAVVNARGTGDDGDAPEFSAEDGYHHSAPSRANARLAGGGRVAFDEEVDTAAPEVSPRDSEESAAEVEEEDVATGVSEVEDAPRRDRAPRAPGRAGIRRTRPKAVGGYGYSGGARLVPGSGGSGPGRPPLAPILAANPRSR